MPRKRKKVRLKKECKPMPKTRKYRGIRYTRDKLMDEFRAKGHKYLTPRWANFMVDQRRKEGYRAHKVKMCDVGKSVYAVYIAPPKK